LRRSFSTECRRDRMSIAQRRGFVARLGDRLRYAMSIAQASRRSDRPWAIHLAIRSRSPKHRVTRH
jgi:hypothetical protein